LICKYNNYLYSSFNFNIKKKRQTEPTCLQINKAIKRKGTIEMPSYKGSPIDMYEILKEVTLMEMNKRKRPKESDITVERPPFTRAYSFNGLSGGEEKKITSHEVEVTHANAIQPIDCTIQTYAWGRVGSRSAAARLKASQANGKFEIDEFTPYAELWIGTHPSGMSTLSQRQNGEASTSLSSYINDNPKLHCGNENETDLSYLLKVLSINKVLSIQAHPDKTLARQLHAERPDVYKDDNHKPEMAIAITDDVEGMCGFLPISEIVCNLNKYPDFYDIIGVEAAENAKKLVRSPATRSVYSKLFRSYLEAPIKLIRSRLNNLLRKLRSTHQTELNSTQILIMKLADQFPGDAGIFAPLMLNHLKLKRGEGFFIGANEPHAYIGGDLVECMACSDNVVRAGLTPKLKDIDTLVSMLTYESTLPKITRGKKIDKCTTLYAPPVRDFAIEFIDVLPGDTYIMKDVQSPCVLLTLNGSANLIQGKIEPLAIGLGSTAFVSANTSTTVVSGSDGVRIVRSMSNVYFE